MKQSQVRYAILEDFMLGGYRSTTAHPSVTLHFLTSNY